MSDEVWTTNCAATSDAFTLEQLEAIVKQVGPRRRMTIRVHPLSCPALNVFLEKVLEHFKRTARDPAAVAILGGPLGGVPIIQDQFMGQGYALVMKEIERPGDPQGTWWETEGMMLIKLTPDEEGQEQRSDE